MKSTPTSPPTGTVTFLFTDIEGSTLLAQQHPDEMPSLLAQHHSILRQSIQACNGSIFQISGDAFCAAFYSASEALRAALVAQRRLQQAAWHPAALNVRMGIHTGPAQAGGSEDGPGDYSGYLTLARTQRVMSTAYGGQILISNASAELMRGELPEGVALRDMGEHRLKGLLNLEHLWQVTAPDLPSEFPALQSLNAIPNNLPAQPSSFIGRKAEIAEAVRLLKTTRLLTLTGVGGVGKTRLALQAAAETLEDFKDGVWLVELAPLADPAPLLQNVANVLGVRETPGRRLPDALLDYLRAKKILLVLDNCEHLIEACAQHTENILKACPSVRILATSREALGTPGETILQVPPLAFPDLRQPAPLDELARSEAVQLFIERARAVNAGYAITEQNAWAILQICQRLDGIPLAIELAAARVKMFSAGQILERLDDRFRLLTGGSRAALPRQQTLRALIDWSYDLLPEDERLVLRRLSVFAGGWTFEAAEAVLRQEAEGPLDLLDSLARLIDKSLVIAGEPTDGEAMRYRFLETIRQYAGEKLLEAGEDARLRDRHLDFFLKFAEEAEPHLSGHEQLSWLDRVESEHENLRAALAWGLEKDPEIVLRLGGAVSNFWVMRGFPIEGRRWLTQAFERVEAASPTGSTAAREGISTRAKALLGLGTQILSQGDNHEALAAFQESAALARQSGDPQGLAKALALIGTAEHFLGRSTLASVEEGIAAAREAGDAGSLARALGSLATHAAQRGDLQAARAYLEEALTLNRRLGNRWEIGFTLMIMGALAVMQADFSEAQARFEESQQLFQRIGDNYRVYMLKSEQAHLERRRGQFEQALELYRESIQAWQALGHRGGVAHHLECIAFILAAQGDARRAVQLLGAAEALRESSASPMTSFERLEYDAEAARARQSLEEGPFAEAWAKGRGMAMEEAVVWALRIGE